MAAGCGCELEDVETWGCGAGALGRRSLPQSFADTHTVLRDLRTGCPGSRGMCGE